MSAIWRHPARFRPTPIMTMMRLCRVILAYLVECLSPHPPVVDGLRWRYAGDLLPGALPASS